MGRNLEWVKLTFFVNSIASGMGLSHETTKKLAFLLAVFNILSNKRLTGAKSILRTIERNVNLGFIDVTAFSDLPKLSQL